MPIYEYECRACGHEMEAWQKISDEPLRKCPACGKMKLQKLVSAAGFRLKGGGWYETDFKTSGKKNVAGRDKSSGTTDKTDKKSEKSAAKDTGAAA
ncbi:MAG TPA: zinc ribbon domain-containing protein [Gammaproteobacteria bacterium]|nr:zinc ribbon domain-containing protein [Gammaproteobacteria bacterium]